MRRLVFMLVLLMGSVHPALAQEGDATIDDLELFERFMGAWGQDGDLPSDSPRANFDMFGYSWGPNQKIVEFVQGPHKTDPSKNVVPGFVYWHPVQKELRYTGFNTRGNLYFDGVFDSLTADSYELRYTVHYPDGMLHASPEFEGTSTREYREVDRLVDDDTMETSTYVRIGDGWRRFPDPDATEPTTLRRYRD